MKAGLLLLRAKQKEFRSQVGQCKAKIRSGIKEMRDDGKGGLIPIPLDVHDVRSLKKEQAFHVNRLKRVTRDARQLKEKIKSEYQKHH